jgi:rfaE bifunctional protein nucleotidyltransferase chain/domain
MTHKYVEPDQLSELLTQLRLEKKRIGLCHGVFDLLHPGHIQHFLAAKKHVDVLFVSITADQFVNKGPGRPIFDSKTRISTLGALEAVDFVTVSNSKTAESILETIRPDFYFKGSDYSNEKDDPTGRIADERAIVERFGGSLFFTNEITSSSSKLINRFVDTSSASTRNWLTEFKNSYSIEQINFYIDAISALKILVIGEVIIDQYTTVEALSKSSKDPILAFHLLETNFYAGGVLAIANNCASWVNKVSVVSNIGINDERTISLSSLLNSSIELQLINLSKPTITKHRFIDIGTNAKMFETYDFDPSEQTPEDANKLLGVLRQFKNIDVILVADYGHGLVTESLVDYLTSMNSFLAVNTQANAGNRGYNSLTKYQKVDFFTANSGELQLEFKSKKIDFSVVVPELMKSLSSKIAVVTKGADGLQVFSETNSAETPAFAMKIVDKVGAGDSVFAISSLLAYLNAPIEIIGFLSSIVASHEISQLGHQNSLSLGDLKKHVKSILS